jgi:hypothetical protein
MTVLGSSSRHSLPLIRLFMLPFGKTRNEIESHERNMKKSLTTRSPHAPCSAKHTMGNKLDQHVIERGSHRLSWHNEKVLKRRRVEWVLQQQQQHRASVIIYLQFYPVRSSLWTRFFHSLRCFSFIVYLSSTQFTFHPPAWKSLMRSPRESRHLTTSLSKRAFDRSSLGK